MKIEKFKKKLIKINLNIAKKEFNLPYQYENIFKILMEDCFNQGYKKRLEDGE